MDFDTVDYSNLQRQILPMQTPMCGTFQGRIRRRKRFNGINPNCEVVIHNTRISSENALDLVRPYDIVVDGTDNFPTRYPDQ